MAASFITSFDDIYMYSLRFCCFLSRYITSLFFLIQFWLSLSFLVNQYSSTRFPGFCFSWFLFAENDLVLLIFLFFWIAWRNWWSNKTWYCWHRWYNWCSSCSVWRRWCHSDCPLLCCWIDVDDVFTLDNPHSRTSLWRCISPRRLSWSNFLHWQNVPFNTSKDWFSLEWTIKDRVKAMMEE